LTRGNELGNDNYDEDQGKFKINHAPESEFCQDPIGNPVGFSEIIHVQQNESHEHVERADQNENTGCGFQWQLAGEEMPFFFGW
jgi:hypothetical protein